MRNYILWYKKWYLKFEWTSSSSIFQNPALSGKSRIEKSQSLQKCLCFIHFLWKKIFNCINKSMALNYNIVPRVGLVTISYHYLPLAVHNFSNIREINSFKHLMKIKTFSAAVKINSYTTCIFFSKLLIFSHWKLKKISFKMFFSSKKILTTSAIVYHKILELFYIYLFNLLRVLLCFGWYMYIFISNIFLMIKIYAFYLDLDRYFSCSELHVVTLLC